MDFNHVSNLFELILEGDKKIQFSKTLIFPSIHPKEEDFQKKILSIELSYGYCPEQNCKIDSIKKAFGAGEDGIIKKIPDNVKLEIHEDVTVLKYGTTTMAPEMIDLARIVGVVGYWDYGNLIICCSKKYDKLVENMIQLIQPEKAQVFLKKGFLPSHLHFAIVSV